jgi:hypothetical protein
LYQGTAAAKKQPSTAASSSGSNIVSELEAELASLGLNLRTLPVLEARKKKNGTSVAGVAAVSRYHMA